MTRHDAHEHDAHAHDHGGHDHDHDHLSGGNERRLAWVMAMIGIFMLVEVAGGLISGSLALLADAGHMATDFAALALAYFAARAARRPANEKNSYGHLRLPVLAAFVNGFTLVLLAGWIVFEAVQRLFAPQPVLAGTMMLVAIAGLVVNIIAFRALHGGSGHDINTQGALAHVLGDLLGSVAAILAAVIVMFTGWVQADPLLSMVVAVLIVFSGVRLMRRAAHVLLEGVPPDVSPDEIRSELDGAIDGVEEIHHVHAWSLAPGRPLVTLHARLRPGADGQRVLEAIHLRLRERFKIDHATVQIEFAGCPDVSSVQCADGQA